MERKRSDTGELREELAEVRRELELLEPLSRRAEQAEDEFARFFVQSLDLLCVAGFDGHFKRLNPAWTARLGWTLEELQASPFLDFVHADDQEATLAEVEKLAAGAETILFENRYRHRDARPGDGRSRRNAHPNGSECGASVSRHLHMHPRASLAGP